MDVLELFLAAPAKAEKSESSDSELEALALEFKEAKSPAEATAALKAFMALANKK